MQDWQIFLLGYLFFAYGKNGEKVLCEIEREKINKLREKLKADGLDRTEQNIAIRKYSDSKEIKRALAGLVLFAGSFVLSILM